MDQEEATPRQILKARQERIDLSTSINKTQLVPSVQASGFFCKTCNLTFKDNASYVDHLNSRKHQHNLGIEMMVEKSTVDQVKTRIDYWVQKLNYKEPHLSI
jgi:U4/U6.U5 tri-snRNP component SNU23